MFWVRSESSGSIHHRLRRIEAKLDLILDHLGISREKVERADSRALELMRQGRKLDAIKAYREQTGASLREAKEAVEAMLQGP